MMGLDQFLLRKELIATWRKHPDLHGWMENRWREQTGSTEIFNCVDFELCEADILDCMEAVKTNSLPCTDGPSFGDENEWTAEQRARQKQEDITVLEDALRRLQAGECIVYSSWW